MKYYLLKNLFVTVAVFAFMFSKADEGQDIFKGTCAACHTIGKGRLVGPDLLNISEKRSPDWLIGFIQSSQTVIKSGDADAVAIYKEYSNLLMPDNALSNGQANAVINYIKAASSGSDGGDSQVATTDFLENATQKDIDEGVLLFGGEKRLTNGGASCISCHSVKDDRVFSSGTLAKELTETYDAMGSAGVSAIGRNLQKQSPYRRRSLRPDSLSEISE